MSWDVRRGLLFTRCCLVCRRAGSFDGVVSFEGRGEERAIVRRRLGSIPSRRQAGAGLLQGEGIFCIVQILHSIHRLQGKTEMTRRRVAVRATVNTGT